MERSLLEKLIFTHIVKKYPAIYRTQNVPYCVHRSLPLLPVLTDVYSVSSFPPQDLFCYYSPTYI